MSCRNWILSSLVVCGSAVALGGWRVDEAPPHLTQARALVVALEGSPMNIYAEGAPKVSWDSRPPLARTVCSSFVTLLLQRSYGWSNSFVKDWTGFIDPHGRDYHDAIVERNGFKRILHVGEIRPGDFLAIKYPKNRISKDGAEDTGHIMIVDSMLPDRTTTEPLVTGTHQYFVSVIDSSHSGHGASDTRHAGRGKFSGGIGRGIFRIYTDSTDRIAGYTWSNEQTSKFCVPEAGDLVAGRLDPNRIPSE